VTKEPDQALLSSELTRRRFLAAAGYGGLALGTANLIAACGGGVVKGGTGQAATTRNRLSAGGGTPARGGTFTVGLVGAGSSEQLYPGAVTGVPDLFRVQQLYDNLFNLGDNLQLIPALALSAEPNADATVWTFRLRDGVHWHNGKPFGADDVVYTFRAFGSSSNFANPNVAPFIDFKSLRKRDPLTVEVSLTRPCAQFPSLFTFLSAATWIIPAGSTPRELARQPVGTGPFKYVSFTPGQRSVFAANRDYWEEGKPYVDQVVVDSSFSGSTALVNALLSGAINVLTPLPYAQARQYLDSSKIKVLASPGHTGSFIYMRVDAGPFADARVREAMKLAIDRKLLVENVLNGFGNVGSDGVPLAVGNVPYAVEVPASYDPERARSLLKAAGREGMTATVQTAAINDTFLPAATLIAQQASKVGINLQVKVLPTSTYYTSASGYLSRYMGQDVGAGSPSLTSAYIASTWAGAAFNETHWGLQKPGGPSADRLLFAAIGALDKTRAAALWRQVQELQVEQGGWLNWGYGDDLDAVASAVHGLRESKSFNLNNYRMLDGWLARG
jgi:peptide/nickel transport system substrate-binding protein